MIASIFNKSKPFNYLLIGLFLSVFYVLYSFKVIPTGNYHLVLKQVGIFLALAGSLFIANFITRKNGLSKDNTYTMLFFLLFLVLFPTIFKNSNIVISNLFILLALRRVISLQSLVSPKEKIFDASFWIFIASIFHFWSILYILLVFVSIIFHVSRDYRNWIIPFIAFFTVATIYSVYALASGIDIINHFKQGATVSFDFTYFENIYQNIALAAFSSITVLLVASQITALPAKPLNMHSSYKKIIFAFFIGVAVYVLSIEKNNSFLAFTFTPLSIMGANYLEGQKINWIKESALIIITTVIIALFFLNYSLLP